MFADALIKEERENDAEIDEVGARREPTAEADGPTARREPKPKIDGPAVQCEPELDADEIAAFLRRQGWGCLTLARDSTAYSIPVSFGYDGDSTIYFQLQTDARSEKTAYLDETATATFLAPKVRPPNWTSVVAHGSIDAVPADELDEAYAVLADNAWFPLDPWDDDRDRTEMSLYALRVEEMTGRTSVDG